MKKLSIFITMAFCLALFSCAPSVEIEQKVELDSVTNCEYSVRTYVWVFDYPNSGDMLIEKSYRKTGILINEIDEYKIDQMLKALVVKGKIDELLKTKPCLK